MLVSEIVAEMRNELGKINQSLIIISKEITKEESQIVLGSFENSTKIKELKKDYQFQLGRKQTLVKYIKKLNERIGD